MPGLGELVEKKLLGAERVKRTRISVAWVMGRRKLRRKEHRFRSSTKKVS